MGAPVIADLQAMVEVARRGIVSKSVVGYGHHKLVHFTFAPGQELSEHTASVPAAVQVLAGRGTVTLEGTAHEARLGMLFHMSVGMRHAVQASDDLVVLLAMFRT